MDKAMEKRNKMLLLEILKDDYLEKLTMHRMLERKAKLIRMR
jgi:hypothetical protein